MKNTGVFVVHQNMFKVGETKEAATIIKDLESCSVSFDNGVEEWFSFDQAGWARRLVTSKSITISITGKRNVGDPGNDFVASKAFSIGRDAEGYLSWQFPDGTLVEFENSVYSISNIGAGDSTAVGALEFEVSSNGKPTVTLTPVIPEA